MCEEFETGSVVEFFYPRHNFVGVLSKMETRRIQVESVRDLGEMPIAEVTFEIQPLLKRSQFLVTGKDLDRDQERSFYSGSMKSIRRN